MLRVKQQDQTIIFQMEDWTTPVSIGHRIVLDLVYKITNVEWSWEGEEVQTIYVDVDRIAMRKQTPLYEIDFGEYRDQMPVDKTAIPRPWERELANQSEGVSNV